MEPDLGSHLLLTGCASPVVQVEDDDEDDHEAIDEAEDEAAADAAVRILVLCTGLEKHGDACMLVHMALPTLCP